MSAAYDDIVGRLEALEQGVSLDQLPMADLQRRLESDWQPDSKLLLPDLLSTFLKLAKSAANQVQYGTAIITGVGTAVASATVGHSLGVPPLVVVGSNIDGFTTLVVTFDTLTSTSFNINARDSRETVWSVSRLFGWVAFA